MLPDIKPDIIITDIPYGNLVDWGGEGEINAMLRKLWEISGDDTILAVSMDKSQKVIYDCWKRIEKQNIGKRRFKILSKITQRNRPYCVNGNLPNGTKLHSGTDPTV